MESDEEEKNSLQRQWELAKARYIVEHERKRNPRDLRPLSVEDALKKELKSFRRLKKKKGRSKKRKMKIEPSPKNAPWFKFDQNEVPGIDLEELLKQSHIDDFSKSIVKRSTLGFTKHVTEDQQQRKHRSRAEEEFRDRQIIKLEQSNYRMALSLPVGLCFVHRKGLEVTLTRNNNSYTFQLPRSFRNAELYNNGIAIENYIRNKAILPSTFTGRIK
eukprot:g3202.t1